MVFKAREKSHAVGDENKREEAPVALVNASQLPTQLVKASWVIEVALSDYERIHRTFKSKELSS